MDVAVGLIGALPCALRHSMQQRKVRQRGPDDVVPASNRGAALKA
jgi:hypothetical protein